MSDGERLDEWVCPCGLMRIVLPFTPPLLAICCLGRYRWVRRL